MFTFERNKSLLYLQSSLLKNCDFLLHAFCTRQGGVSRADYAGLNMSFREGDDEYSVLQNWEKLAAAFAIPIAQFLVVNQVHSDGIFVIEKKGSYFSSRAELDYDAIATDRPGVAVCVKTADCVPVFIADKENKVIINVHAGWRGSASGITAKAVSLLRRHYHSAPRNILAAIGPAIGNCCYEVDAVAAGAFATQNDKDYFLFPLQGKERWMLDLPEANRRQLIAGGVPEANIDSAGLCTACRQDLFFSHRASGGVTGRQINFMMIKDEAPCIVTTLDNKAFWRE